MGFWSKWSTKRTNRAADKNVLKLLVTNLILNSKGVIKRKDKTLYICRQLLRVFLDVLSNLLHSLGFKNHLVDIGGELRGRGLKYKGKEKWTVVWEMPYGRRKVSSIVNLFNKAIATSGNYRNFRKSKNG